MTSASVTKLPPRERLWTFQHRCAPYLFLLPLALVLCAFLLWPLARSLVLSTYTMAGPRTRRFVGLGNYRFLILHDRLFWLAVLNTAAYTLAFVTIQVPLSLGLAILMNNKAVRFRNILRFCFFSTHLVGQVFVAVVFFALLGPREGLVNRVLGVPFGRPLEIGWLTNPNLVMFSTLFAGLWLSVGYGMIYFLAALQSVDRDLYEAAALDGAGRWSAFWHVTLPGISPVLVFLTLIGIIGGFQLFELPYVLFQGPGPNYRVLTIVMYLFSAGFDRGDLGYAAAIGWLLVAMLSAVALVQLKVSRTKWDE